jgi:hypothetical protein
MSPDAWVTEMFTPLFGFVGLVAVWLLGLGILRNI